MADTKPATPLVAVAVDGRSVEVAPGTWVWDACEKAGVYVPVYCAHKKLEPVAVCRMCLVEVEGMPKLQPACSTRVAEGMVVRTATEQVRKFREGNLEFLLINHPLDCPVCDRGGECDLQDFTLRYGPGQTRTEIGEKVHFDKAVKLSDKIVLDQERCILCWRCVRYYEEITGEREIVLQQRGVHTLVDTFEGRQLESEFQGNLPEICPVGALTHQQYRFQARPWDLRRTASVCPKCSYGCNIFIDAREDQVARFASNDNPEVDDSWLCDTGRYSFPELNRSDRVFNPEARLAGARQTVSYRDAVARAAGALLRVRGDHGPEAIAFLGSTQVTNEEAFLIQWLGREVVGTPHVDHRLSALPEISPEQFDLGIAEIEECAAVVVLGDEPELSDPVLTLRLFKAETKLHREVLRQPKDAAPEQVAKKLAGRELVGIVAHQDQRLAAMAVRASLARRGTPAKVLTIVAGMNARGCQDLGLTPGLLPGYRPVPTPGRDGADILKAAADGAVRALVVVGQGWEEEPSFEEALARVEVLIGLTPFSGAVARHASVLLPGRTIAEKAGTVTNTEGRVQRVRPGVQPRYAFPSDLRILGDLALGMGAELGVQPLAGPVFELIAQAVPGYRGCVGGLRANWTGSA
ncbi:MAG TPA: 2Fe-2S iron-sulfur cluster-binding protein [Candidatus Dormibacteraeota bacterium]|nr:2Fe-2S iron-sulfur cluster-binding protein [Candidatus Dormibacteraeota bacterium]